MSLRSPVWNSLRLLVAVALFGTLAMTSLWQDSRGWLFFFLALAIAFELAFWRSLLRRRRRTVIDTRPPEERGDS